MKIISSFDDGHPLDLVIADALKKNSIDGIFYIPNTNNGNLLLTINEIKQLSNDGFEIGGHTVTHPNDMKELTDEQLKKEVFDNKSYLENIIGKKITSFAYPKGRYNQRVIEEVKLAGYTNARTVDVMNTEFCEDVFRTKTSIHIHHKRPEYNGMKLLEVAEEKLIKAKKENGIFHFWGHSEEIIRLGLYNEFLDLIQIINKYKD